MITLEQLIQVFGKAATEEKVKLYYKFLVKAMTEFEINTKRRQAAFLANIGFESAYFRYLKEIASGEKYEGREDLGNTSPGDGVKYKGRGFIQITGKFNYRECGEALEQDFVNNPALLESPENAARSAAWFWKKHGLNELADKDQLREITHRINGGLNGLFARIELTKQIKEILGDE